MSTDALFSIIYDATEVYQYLDRQIAQPFRESAVDRTKAIINKDIEDHFSKTMGDNGRVWRPRRDPSPQHPLLFKSGKLKEQMLKPGIKGKQGQGNQVIFRYHPHGNSKAAKYAWHMQKGSKGYTDSKGVFPRPYAWVSYKAATEVANMWSKEFTT